MKKYKLNERQYEIYKQIINEDQESDSQKKAIKYLVDEDWYTEGDAEEFVRVRLRMLLPALNANKKAGKFTLGCVRIIFEEEFLEDNGEEIDVDKKKKAASLNKIIKHIISEESLYKSFDKNLNGWSFNKLSYEFRDIHFNDKLESEKVSGHTKYKICKIDDFEHSSTFSEFVSWCITKYESSFNDYSRNGDFQFYFAIKMEDLHLQPKKGENAPLDEYGLSMLAICVDEDGDLESCTCRWNHDNGGNDHILSVEQIEEITNLNFYKTFKPKSGEAKINAIKYAKEHVKNIKTIGDIREFQEHMKKSQFGVYINNSKFGIFTLDFRDFGYIYVDVDYESEYNESYLDGAFDEHRVKKIKVCNMDVSPVSDGKSLFYKGLDGKIYICDRTGRDQQENVVSKKLNRAGKYTNSATIMFHGNDNEKDIRLVAVDDKIYTLSGELVVDTRDYVGKWEICDFTSTSTMFVQCAKGYRGNPYIFYTGYLTHDNRYKPYKIIFFDLRTSKSICKFENLDNKSDSPRATIYDNDFAVIYFDCAYVYSNGKTKKFNHYEKKNLDGGFERYYEVVKLYNDENDITMIVQNKMFKTKPSIVKGLTNEIIDNIECDNYGRLYITMPDGEHKIVG